MPSISAIANATGTLTNAGADFANADTVTIGGKVYTLQAALTNVDGNIKIGASVAATLTNIFNAINAVGGVPGTDYALAMTANPHVRAITLTATTVIVQALVAGAIGNFVATTKSSAGGAAWGGAVLAAGAGSIDLAIRQILAAGQVNADVFESLDKLGNNPATV